MSNVRMKRESVAGSAPFVMEKTEGDLTEQQKHVLADYQVHGIIAADILDELDGEQKLKRLKNRPQACGRFIICRRPVAFIF